MKRNYRKLYAIINKQGLDREQVLAVHGNGAEGFGQMNDQDFITMVNALQGKQTDPHKASRNAIVHYLCLMDYTKNGKPDTQRIDAFIRNIGTRNPDKKGLFQLNKTELNKVLTQVKAMYQNELKRA